MNEWFTKLKEIDSLEKIRTQTELDQLAQEQRLSKLQAHQDQRLQEKQEALILRRALKEQLAQAEGQIKNYDQQKIRLMEMGGDDQKIADYSRMIDEQEELGLSLMEKMEAQSLIILAAEEFLQGLSLTMHEIEQEVQAARLEAKGAVDNLGLRLKLLAEDLPENFRSTLIKVKSKKLAHGPFTRVEAGSCYFCRFKLSRLDESEIDMQKNLKLCHQCGRIFLPYGS